MLERDEVSEWIELLVALMSFREPDAAPPIAWEQFTETCRNRSFSNYSQNDIFRAVFVEAWAQRLRVSFYVDHGPCKKHQRRRAAFTTVASLAMSCHLVFYPIVLCGKERQKIQDRSCNQLIMNLLWSKKFSQYTSLLENSAVEYLHRDR